jgi:uncharacterized protein
VTIEPIDVRDLVGQPGTSRTVSIRGELPGLGSELATLSKDQQIRGRLLLESVVEGLLVSGSVSGAMALRCARCLTDVERPFEVELHEPFATGPDEGDDTYPLVDEGWVEPEQMLRDVVGVELPFAPLCRPDCLGLCGVCGEDRNLGACPGHVEVDPRWAELDRLLEPSTET